MKFASFSKVRCNVKPLSAKTIEHEAEEPEERLFLLHNAFALPTEVVVAAATMYIT